MIQVAFYGRGGQGVVKSSQLLGQAAFNAGFYSQAFPFFGSEKRGSPLFSYVRIDEKPIRLREHIQEADYLILLDTTLVDQINMKAKNIFINSNKKFPNIKSFDISEIIKEFPQATNTAMVSVFAAVSCIIPIDSLIKACEIFPEAARQKNIEIIKKVFEKCQR